MARPRIAIFDFTGCEGCELQIINCEDELLKIVGAVEIVNFREAQDRRDEEYDVALIDGGISTDRDMRRIKAIREKAALLVAIGTCAALG
jgi:sulfhydrogenase subunit delta